MAAERQEGSTIDRPSVGTRECVCEVSLIGAGPALDSAAHTMHLGGPTVPGMFTVHARTHDGIKGKLAGRLKSMSPCDSSKEAWKVDF